ncbi:unnamed protein product [Sphagnum jensenii]|uniref:Uncharacterized protein n=1 Tax=Sphagnum jensenii TaxID=128206 RepID=A0ABP0WUG2_9BRYO
MKGPDIWQDTTCLMLLREGMLPEMIEVEEGKRARKRIEHYCWKEQKLFFKDLCGIQASTKFSPFMILIGRSPHLRANNSLSALTSVVDDEVDIEHTTAQFLNKGDYDFEEGCRMCIVQDADGR